MREIKFRGVTPAGETVYGDLTHYAGHTYIADKRVQPEPIDLLIGFDANGDEIYEGDKLINQFGETFEPEVEVVFYGKSHHFSTTLGATSAMTLKK